MLLTWRPEKIPPAATNDMLRHDVARIDNRLR